MNEVAEAEPLLSPNWWQSRTSAQLHDMVQNGIAAGEYYAGAHREIERRARERARVEWQQAQHRAAREKDIRIGMLGVFEIALLVALIALIVR